MKILDTLQKRKLKQSQVSKELKITVAEASRHLERLSEDKLIRKQPSGQYELTPFGSLIWTLLPSLAFASKHRDYFMEYDAFRIPLEFIARMGELRKGESMPNTLRNLEQEENEIREAHQFVWILSDQILTSTVSPLAEKVKGPFELRIILPEGGFPPESVSRLPSRIPSIQKRVLPKIDALVVLTEKYAVFCLPNRSGNIDYTGFAGKDPEFHKWCKDLYLHYWEKAKPL